jgi:anti-sigma factor RsiW
MNCDEFEKQVLLEQSGELAEKNRILLERHQAQCDRCRAFREAGTAILDAARAVLPTEPDADILRRVQNHATARATSPILLFYRPGIQALACAAALLLAVAGWLLFTPRNGEMRLHDMNIIITMMMDEETLVDQVDSGEGATDLKALAELLLQAEESAVDGSTDQEEQLWELDSRVLQLRSTPESFPGIYG